LGLPGTSRELPDALLREIGLAWSAVQVSLLPLPQATPLPAMRWHAPREPAPARQVSDLPRAWLQDRAPAEPQRLLATAGDALPATWGMDEILVLPLALHGRCAAFLVAERR